MSTDYSYLTLLRDLKHGHLCLPDPCKIIEPKSCACARIAQVMEQLETQRSEYLKLLIEATAKWEYFEQKFQDCEADYFELRGQAGTFTATHEGAISDSGAAPISSTRSNTKPCPHGKPPTVACEECI